MKTKKEPTHDQIVDFYYFLLSCHDEFGEIYNKEGHEEKFSVYPEHYREYVNSDLERYPRETSPEEYEYYISDINLRSIRSGKTAFMGKRKTNYVKHKIKITICED